MTRRRMGFSVCASVLAALFSLAAPAHATVFDQPAQPLDAALRRIADAGRVQVLFSGDMVRGRVSAPVQGAADITQAFDTALRASGLTVRQINARTYIVVALPAARAPTPSPQPGAIAAEPVAEVLVRAARRALVRDRDLSADAEETASVNGIAILSRTTLERQPARTVSEALGALPGMTVLPTGQSFIGGVDSASRAEGMFSAFRGLNTEFNLNMVNGVSLAQGLPYSRGVQLSLLPPSAFQSIVLHKTPRIDMDGDVVGAAVDFRTPTAFDFPGRSHFGLSLSAGNNSRAQAYGAADASDGFSVEYARRFGAGDQFGIYAATWYERRVFANSEMAGIMSAQNDDGWAFGVSDNSKGTNPANMDPERNLTLYSLNVGISTGENLSRSHVLSLDWRPDASFQAWLYATSAATRTQQRSTHSQFVGRDPSWIDDGTGAYRLSIGSVSTRVWYETNPDYAALSSLNAGMRRRAGNWTLSPALFYSQGKSDRPSHIEASERIDQVDGVNSGTRRTFSGPSILYDANGWPVPQFTPQTLADFNDPNSRLLARRAGQLISQFSTQVRRGGRFDAEYRPDTAGALRDLKVGVKYTENRRDLIDHDWTNGFFGDLFGKGGLNWADLGISNAYYAAAFPGRYDWRLPRVDEAALVDYFRRFQSDASFDSCGHVYVNNLNCNTEHGEEDVAAAYLSAVFAAGRFEISPAVRFEETRIRNTYWVLPQPAPGAIWPDTPGTWASNRSDYRQALPSLTINYRPDEARVYRLSLWRGYALPSLFLLGGGERFDTSDDGTPILRRGNPALRAVEALNLDLSAEGRVGDTVFALSAYHKGLDHYLYDNWSTTDAPGQVGNVRVVMPQNGGRAQVNGLEAEMRRTWSRPLGMPGAIVVSGNLSRQWTVVDLGQDTFGHRMPIQNAPDWLGNASVGYSAGDISLTLIASHTGAYLSDYNTLDAAGDWDNTWVRPSSRLDLQGGWQVGPRARFDLSVTNIGGAVSYWAHVGKHSLAISDIIDSGRQARLTLRYRY